MKIKTVKANDAEQITFRIDPEVKHLLRVKIVKEGSTIQEVYEKLTIQYLES